MEVEYAKDSKGTSCLHIALMRGHYHIAEFFLNKTSDQQRIDLQKKPIQASNKLQKEAEEKKQKLMLRQLNQAITWEQ